MNASPLSVKQLNFYVRSLLEGDARLNCVTVTGELSDFKNHYASGHFYFTLKDSGASVRCVMFRSFAARVGFTPENGQQVILSGKISLYEKDGQYQLYAEEMLPAGEGDMALLFRRTKEKLEREGLFDPASKRAVPKFPKTVAVVTAETGAAVRDIFNILSRRWPPAEIIFCPTAVQGELAVPQMLDALDRLYALGRAEVIIIGRGGGSAEDLAAFNDERLARKVYESPVPIISAVGHETDFSICDFTADLRAPTPSAAAELAVPDIAQLSEKITKYRTGLKNSLIGKYGLCSARLEACLRSDFFRNPETAFTGNRSVMLDRLNERLLNAENGILRAAVSELSSAAERLDMLSPLKVLSRGYAHVAAEGGTVSSVSDIKIGDSLKLSFGDGTAECEVTAASKYNN